MSRPIAAPTQVAVPGLGEGVWRATVATTDPLTVVVPLAFGQDLAVPAEPSAVVGDLVRGDPVWVSRVGGTTSIAVVGRRDQPAPGWLPGMIVEWAGATAPAGWLLCQGQAVSRADYAALFAAIGVAYGAGNGSTTFNVPDLRRRVPVGLDAADSDFDTLGKTGGAKTASVPGVAHTHSVPGVAHSHGLSANGFALIELQASSPFIRHKRINTPAWTDNVSASTNPSVGSSSASNTLGTELGGATDSATPSATTSGSTTPGASSASTVQPFTVVNYLIKL